MTGFPYRPRLLRVHPLDSPVVALAVRTRSGARGRNGGISGVSAVKFHGDRVLDTFAASGAAGLGGLRAFVGDSPVAAHGLPEALGAGGNLEVWDTQELAGLIIPASAGDSLELLAEHLGVSAPADAELTQAVYRALVERTRELPASVLRRLSEFLWRAQSPLAELVDALAESPATMEAGPIGGLDPKEVASRLERRRALGQPNAPRQAQPDEVEKLLSQDGPLARRFPRYEARAQQVEMAKAVARNLDPGAGAGDRQLVVEGGTGIGKTVAYLLPAILFAARNNARIVVSTNTINLQEQLVGKDIPDLLAALEGEPGLDLSGFRYAQLKGKANYLCLQRWQAMANADTGSPDDARALAKTLAWLRETRTGDRSELRLSGRELGAWDRMNASKFGTCSGAREAACFYRHAREEAAAAHLLVVNHSLLLSDLQVEGSLLPEYDYLIIDEAHNLEAEATRQFGFRVTQSTVEDIAERLGALTHGVGASAQASVLAPERKETMLRRAEEAQAPLYRVRDAWAQLTAGMERFVRGQRGADSEESEVRITQAQRAQPDWSELQVAGTDFEQAANEVELKAEALLQEAEGLSASVVPGLDELKGDLAEWLGDQAAARERVREFVNHPDAHTVYWIGRGSNLSLNGAPLDVGARLQEELFGSKKGVALTSATLTVAGGFAHVRSRLGIEAPEELALGSPFDYEKAALLCLPTDVPEPNANGYGEAVAEVIRILAETAGGKTMALFTSHAGVRATAAKLRPILPRRGIDVLAQGVDGSPQQLLTRFQRSPEAALLGTASFWEGVDVGNEALKVLVVARLPFNVPTEPIFAARSEEYENSFMQYALPQAVLRFRQGFGRLIRSKGDRGVVVVLDSRIATKQYGRTFLSSIPPATVRRGPFRQLAPEVAQWLADGSLSALRASPPRGETSLEP